MRKEPSPVVFLKWLCWSFVAGVGAANILGFQGSRTVINAWPVWGFLLIFAVYLYFTSRQLVKPAVVPLIMAVGIASYLGRFDTDNPDHISNFRDTSRWENTLIRGTIVEDPDVRDWVTHVVVKPEEVVENPDSGGGVRKLSGETGLVILFVSRLIRNENPYYDNMEFGDRLEIRGALVSPMVLTNPYGFDYARYLENRNIFASMYIGSPKAISCLGNSALGMYGKLKKFAYRIKDRMILGIKKTVPPPASAFLGGVTVGARGGVPEVIKYDFQATGVAHVLALSGLHVGFLALILIMIFNNFLKSPLLFYRLPSKLAKRELDLTPYSQKLIPLFIIIVLAVFVIITGARPATIRASLMFSIAITLSLWFGMNFERAGSLTIPVAAAIMLAFNPFIIFDASFVLSFAAVWSIVYLTRPLSMIFTGLIAGWGQLVFFIFFVSTLAVLVINPQLFYSGRFTGSYIALLVLFGAGAYFLEKKRPLRGFEFEAWWPGIRGFFCVQLAIQIGMMWPLSGVYFNRFPVAGMLANFIAIPLIGIIVPLGLLGEIFTFIPFIGDHIGLAIGGTNTILCNIFLGMAKFFRIYFPYPVQSAPAPIHLAVYYLMVIVFAFNRSIREFLSSKFRFSRKASSWTVAGIIAFIFTSSYYAPGFFGAHSRGKGELLVTFLDVEYGNCILIQTPGGKAILIDGGSRGDKRFWTMSKFGKGQSVILPNLSGYNISALDKVILTSPLPENTGGLIYILNHFRVREVWDSLEPAKFPAHTGYPEFLKNINDVRLQVRRDDPLPIGAYLNYYDFINSAPVPADTDKSRSLWDKMFGINYIPRYWAHDGIIIHREDINGQILELKALHPPVKRVKGTESDLLNNSLVLKLKYGTRSFLFASNIWSEGEDVLIDNHSRELSADVLAAPDHGSIMGSSGRFLDKVRPSVAVVQYGYLRDRSFYSGELERTLRKYYKRSIKVHRTDTAGAVQIRTDGQTLDIETVLGEDR